MHEYLDGWLDGWMDGMDGLMYGWIWILIRVNQIDRRVDLSSWTELELL